MNTRSPFSVKKETDSTGFLLWQVTALWQRKIAAVLRPYQLTQVQYALLATLFWFSKKTEYMTQTMLAQQTKLDIMMTSQVLRTLESKGLIKRQPHPTDTRAKILQLTKKGIDLVWKTVPMVEKEDAAFFKSLSAEHKAFNDLLITLISSCQETSKNLKPRKKLGESYVDEKL